ncbi:hypothetical protein HPO96_14660 [Kribbella sandramycini]|uniref:Uncharacterized protein n=1 Tax=Kribbella sandramycini TaxID=60450 RepID=A0A7Y4L123_9ACTN|nr:hypothetical protein [Kribbella sandramycini]MBB6565217.1 hypothetical protein [Kribbella sandramycini]NOL41486.1 hypothetical protein [Kribbella sandramycini]
MSEPHDDVRPPGRYQGAFGAASYGSEVPRQVTVATVVVLGFGVLYLLLGLMALTSAGDQISEIVLGSKGSGGVVATAALAGAVLYALPALYLRKRRPWARYLVIAIAVLGVVAGLLAFPTGLLGLAVHAALLVLMLHPTTKRWFR